jgi:hypothetical protein
MKTLNFHPYYGDYLRAKKKTTTLRLSNRNDLQPGETVMLTLGWEEATATPLHPVRIRSIYSRRIRDLSPEDLEGESPDCRDSETARLVLGSVYRTELTDEHEVTVVKFDHICGERR